MKLFPEDQEFFDIVDDDRRYFMEKLEECCGPFLLGDQMMTAARKYSSFLQDVLQADEVDYDKGELQEFVTECCQSMKGLSPKQMVLQIASEGKDRFDWDVSIDSVMSMYEINPLTKSKSIEDFADPICRVSKTYIREVTLEDAARELGLPMNEEDAERLGMRSHLRLEGSVPNKRIPEPFQSGSQGWNDFAIGLGKRGTIRSPVTSSWVSRPDCQRTE